MRAPHKRLSHVAHSTQPYVNASITDDPRTRCVRDGDNAERVCPGWMVSVERGSSVVECRTRKQVNPGSNPSLLPFRRLGMFVLSIDAPVRSAV